MAIKLKTKVALGGIFLFALLILVGAVSFFYFNRLSLDTKEIIKDNYESLNYSREMLNELNERADSAGAFGNFEKNLLLQENNITEPGEKEMTASLRKHFNELKEEGTDDPHLSLIRKDISRIMQVNLQAIDKKNQAAQASAERAKAIITICLTVCLLIGFTFLFNFPSLVASPIASLTEGIKAIASKNYGQRIHLNRKDEFGDLANAFNSMAEKLDEYEHSNLSKIMFEKQRAETVINSLKDASIGIDNKGVILFANQQALQLLSLSEQDIVGQMEETVKKSNDLFRFLINEQNTIPFKIVLDGKENYFTKEIMDINQQDKKAGSVIVLKNITPFKQLDVAKTNFIATVSHELKTPLASSDLSLKLLEDERVGSLTAEQKELVQSLKEDNNRLLRILSELLDMSQVETGNIQLSIQQNSPHHILQFALETVKVHAAQKQIELKIEEEKNLPQVKADMEKTGWVLINFLTNAIRYSPEQSVVLVEIKKEMNNVRFSVKDNGRGIESRYREKIFDRYFQIPGSSKSGTGLGLAISKDFIEAQGGKIGVETEIGLGSKFYFELLPA